MFYSFWCFVHCTIGLPFSVSVVRFLLWSELSKFLLNFCYLLLLPPIMPPKRNPRSRSTVSRGNSRVSRGSRTSRSSTRGRQPSEEHSSDAQFAEADNSLATEQSSSVPESLLNVLVELRNSQAAMQESSEKFQATTERNFARLEAGKSCSSASKMPNLESKAFSKQYEFNDSVWAGLQSLKDSVDSDKALELIDLECDKISRRNKKLVMADRFPGSLTYLESMQDFAELKNDPECGPFVSDAIQMSMQNRRGSGGPFRGRGRGRYAPYSSGQNQSGQGQIQLPNSGSAPYYVGEQQGMVISGGYRQRRVVGPCNLCYQMGHLQRNCPQAEMFHQFNQFPQRFSGQYRGQRFIAPLQNITAPPAAITWPSGNQASTPSGGQQ